jgi:hypothetical protein
VCSGVLSPMARDSRVRVCDLDAAIRCWVGVEGQTGRRTSVTRARWHEHVQCNGVVRQEEEEEEEERWRRNDGGGCGARAEDLASRFRVRGWLREGDEEEIR